ncbi:MAG: hypothetical protein ACYCPQ_04750 [Elusimicrobiota bacterium]
MKINANVKIVVCAAALAGLGIRAQADTISWDSPTDSPSSIHALAVKGLKKLNAQMEMEKIASSAAPAGSQILMAKAVDGDISKDPASHDPSQLKWIFNTVNGTTRVGVEYFHLETYCYAGGDSREEEDQEELCEYYTSHRDHYVRFVFPQLTLAGNQIMYGKQVVARLTSESVWAMAKGWTLGMKPFATKYDNGWNVSTTMHLAVFLSFTQ